MASRACFCAAIALDDDVGLVAAPAPRAQAGRLRFVLREVDELTGAFDGLLSGRFGSTK